MALATHQKSGDFLERLLLAGKAASLGGSFDQSFEPLQREREMCSALGPGYCMDLVDDD